MEESFEGAVSFALSALRKSMLVPTRPSEGSFEELISRKDTLTVRNSGAESLDMGSPSYSSACRIVGTTMEEYSALPFVLVVYSLVALPRCNNPCRGSELHCLCLRRCS